MEDELPKSLEEFLFWENQLDQGFSAIVEAPDKEVMHEAEEKFVNLLKRVKTGGMDDLYQEWHDEYIKLLSGEYDKGYVEGE